MFVLRVLFEMAGEIFDLLGEQGNLDLRRAGVLVVDRVFLDHPLLFLGSKH